MARLRHREYALGQLLQTIRPSLSLTSTSDRGFVLDFFDQICYEKLSPGQLPLDESKKNRIAAGWFRGMDRRDLNKILSGKRPLPVDVARRILPAITEQKVVELWHESSTFDAIRDLAVQFHQDGIAVKKPVDVPRAVYKLLKEVIRANANGHDLLDELPDSEKVIIPRIQNYQLTTGRIVNNSLQIDSSSIKISDAPPVPADLAPEEIYFQRALEAIAEKLGEDSTSFDNGSTLPDRYKKFLVRQRTHYWSAVGRQRNLQEICPEDGDQQFEHIKDDLDDFLETTWMSDTFQNGYERMLETLKQASNYNIGGSVLTSIEHLFDATHKQGMTHMLVNDERIEWLP